MSVLSSPVLVSDVQVAERLKLSRRCVQKWRQKKLGPPYVKMGKAIRYDSEALEAWIRSRTVSL